MIDFNKEEDRKRIKRIKEYPEWKDYWEMIEQERDKIINLENINTDIELQAAKMFKKFVNRVYDIMNKQE